MTSGTIEKLVRERGFGFIKCNGGPDLFFHCSQVNRTAFESMREGQSVAFQVNLGHHGFQAVNVKPIEQRIK